MMRRISIDAESLKTTLVDGGVINLGASFNMMNENTVAGRNQINADTVLNLNNETLTLEMLLRMTTLPIFPQYMQKTLI